MVRTVRYAVLSLALSALVACVRGKEEQVEPAVLKAVPAESAAEPWRAHDLSVIVVCDLEAEVSLMDTPWAAISSNELTGSGQHTITIALQANEGDAPRTGRLVARCGSAKVESVFTQLPLGSSIGAFNYDGQGADYPFDELLHQSSVRCYPDGTQDFRILSPYDGKFLVFKGLPASLKAGDRASASLIQNCLGSMQYQRSVEFEVVKTADGKAWLAEGDAVYIIKYR